MKDDRIYLFHVRECLGRIAQYTLEGEAVFRTDAKTQNAVLRDLQVLAESTRRLSKELKERHPEVPWRAISAFRNILVHDYLGIDLGQVWTIVTTDLPPLMRAIDHMSEEAGPPPPSS